MKTMPKIVNTIALILLLKVLVLTLCLFGWDYYETKKMLNAVEVQRDNTVQLNSILEVQIKECEHAHH